MATKSSFLVPNRRNRYGWEMPARVAMASVDVPAYPARANSVMAAASTAVRRSEAVIRVETIIVYCECSLTICQAPAAPAPAGDRPWPGSDGGRG